MSKSSKRAFSTIGRCRSGTYVRISSELCDETVDTFLDRFTVDEQIDIFCLTECLMLSESRCKHKGMFFSIFGLIYNRLETRASLEPMNAQLDALGLLMSPARVRHGLNLKAGWARKKFSVYNRRGYCRS